MTTHSRRYVARRGGVNRPSRGGPLEGSPSRGRSGLLRLLVGLRDLGLELVEDLNDFQLVARYDPAGVNGLKPTDRSHIARVRVRGPLAKLSGESPNG